MSAIAKLKKVSATAVLKWIRKYSRLLGDKLEPQGKYAVVEIDEMWHYFQKKLRSSGSSKHIVAKAKGLSTGRLVIGVM